MNKLIRILSAVLALAVLLCGAAFAEEAAPAPRAINAWYSSAPLCGMSCSSP